AAGAGRRDDHRGDAERRALLGQVIGRGPRGRVVHRDGVDAEAAGATGAEVSSSAALLDDADALDRGVQLDGLDHVVDHERGHGDGGERLDLHPRAAGRAGQAVEVHDAGAYVDAGIDVDLR